MQDQIAYDQPQESNNQSNYYDPYQLGGAVKITTFNMRGIFSQRGITMQITIPFYYLSSGQYGSNRAVFGSYQEGELVNLLKLQFQGSYLGTFDPNSKYQTFNIDDQCKCNSVATGDSRGGITESRTYSKALNGEVGFTYSGEGIGASMKGGGQINWQTQSTTLYTYQATFTLDNSNPNAAPHVDYTMGGESLGVQHN